MVRWPLMRLRSFYSLWSFFLRVITYAPGLERDSGVVIWSWAVIQMPNWIF